MGSRVVPVRMGKLSEDSTSAKHSYADSLTDMYLYVKQYLAWLLEPHGSVCHVAAIIS